MLTALAPFGAMSLLACGADEAEQAGSPVSEEYRAELAEICAEHTEGIRNWVVKSGRAGRNGDPGELQGGASSLAAKEIGSLIEELEDVPAPSREDEFSAHRLTRALGQLQDDLQGIADAIGRLTVARKPGRQRLYLQVARALSGALKPDADELAEIAREDGVGACGLFGEAGPG